jgi:hypothetical protein
MSVWALIGWGGLAAASAIVWFRHRRRERSMDGAAEFLAQLRECLSERHPDVLWHGVVPGRFTVVLGVDGQETPVTLRALHAHWQAFPDSLERLLHQVLAEVRRDGLDQLEHHEFADVALLLLPQIRTADWLRARAPAFGDSAIVHRPLGADLALCYVIDDEWSMVFVTHGHLRRWRRTEVDVFHLASRNLERQADAPMPLPERGDGPVVVRSDAGYEAARVLLEDPERVDGLLMAMPERGVLCLGAAGSDLPGLMALTAEHSSRAARPLSKRLYRIRDGRFEDVLEPVGER